MLVYLSIFLFAILEGEIYYIAMCVAVGAHEDMSADLFPDVAVGELRLVRNSRERGSQACIGGQVRIVRCAIGAPRGNAMICL